MLQQHPITPPLELVEQLRNDAPHGIRDAGVTRERHLAIAAYRAGADAELEECCEWVANACPLGTAKNLRTARRPKPPSLAEEAETALLHLIHAAAPQMDTNEPAHYIRAALVRLQQLELENNG